MTQTESRPNARAYLKGVLADAAHLWASILASVFLIYLVLYYVAVLPFYGGFVDMVAWARLRYAYYLVGFLLVSSVWLSVIGYRRGYKAGEFSLRRAAAVAAGVTAVHLLLSAVAGGRFFVTGAAYFAASFSCIGGAETEAAVSLGKVMPYLLLFDVVYAVVLTLATRYGAMKRRKERST